MSERFYDPKEGEIYLDKTNLKDISLSNLRESIGYVAQEPVLILGSIRDNLMFSNCEATDTDIETAVKRAHAQFIYQMPKQLDEYVGSSTVMNFSGG